MILADCILTKECNNYWNKIITEKFPILYGLDKINDLSLKEYIIEIPQKLYNHKFYEEYYSFLISISQNGSTLLSELFIKEAHKLNIAFETLNEINKLQIHDKSINIFDELEVIRFIENDIHYNYLQLIECTVYPFILLIAKSERMLRGKSFDGLDVYNCIQELNNTPFEELKNYYNNTIRNGIAHGDFIYTSNGIIYKGKKGEPYKTNCEEIIYLFDNMVDCCNAMALAIKCFMITQHDYCRKNGFKSPKTNLIHELKAQANTPQWKVVDCLESCTINDKRQLNIFVYNKLFDLESVNYYGLRSAIMAEYFAPGYDRYFINFKSKYSKVPGWGAYSGLILSQGRIMNSLEAYQNVLCDGLLFFIPKWKFPKSIIKIYTLGIICKEHLKFWKYKQQKNFVIRETNIHRKPQMYLCINDARVYLKTSNPEEVKTIIYSQYREIINNVKIGRASCRERVLRLV